MTDADSSYSSSMNNDINITLGLDELKRFNETYISSDFHILKAFIERDEDNNKYIIPIDRNKIDTKRLDTILKLCKKIDTNKAFIHLGDLTESEFEEGSAYIEEVKKFYQKILGKGEKHAPRILIRGNNDCLSKETYLDFGFDYVVTKLELGNLLLTHKPANVGANKLNIHGHLHESKSYFDISPERHINAYWETANGPQTIIWFLNNYINGAYSDTYVKNSDEYRTSDMIENNGVNYE